MGIGYDNERIAINKQLSLAVLSVYGVYQSKMRLVFLLNARRQSKVYMFEFHYLIIIAQQFLA